jgi:hypothetical protein
LGAGAKNLLYATVLHFLAGVLTGSVFKVRTLLALLFLIFSEAAVLVIVATELAAIWAITNLLAIQTGYCSGVYLGQVGRAGRIFSSPGPGSFTRINDVRRLV